MSQNAVSATSARIKKLVTLAMLTAVTYVVMLLCKSIPDVAGFLQLEVKDTVICIGGFIYGPVSAAVIAVVVAVIEMLTVSGIATTPDYDTAFILHTQGYAQPELPTWAMSLVINEEDILDKRFSAY